MSERYVSQCKLRQGTLFLTSYLDTKKKFKVGSWVTLKGLDGWWVVEKIGRPVLANSVEKTWNNNI